MSGIDAKKFLENRRRRALGSILGYAEREIYPALSKDQQLAFREVVMGSLNSYHDTTLDLFKSEDYGSLRNEEVFALLERIEQRQITQNGR